MTFRSTPVSPDANTFRPIYRSSKSKSREMVVNYGKEVSGYYYDKQTKKRHTIKDQGNAFLTAIPIRTCWVYYRLQPVTGTSWRCITYKPNNAGNTKKARIEEVKSNMYTSSLTGAHKVWQVSVYEEATKDSYVYYIDKDTRRIWKVDILTQGQRLLLIDKRNRLQSLYHEI